MPLRSILLALIVVLGAACSQPEPERLVVYSGRSKSLVDPLIQQFSQESGIEVDVRYGDTAQLAVALLEEGDRSPADLFWAQDAGALGAVEAAGLFAVLGDSLQRRVNAPFQSSKGHWVGTSGRARTLAWSTERLSEDELPTSIFDLAGERFSGRVGWAPTNGSFQAAVTALRRTVGADSTRNWLVSLKNNGAVAYGNNRAILEGIAAGEVDLGLPNHYYLYRYTAADSDYPVAQRFFEDGDAGNLINVAGIGVLASSTRQALAEEFVSFLLGSTAQTYFVQENYEYPLVDGVAVPENLGGASRLEAVVPNLDLNELSDLEQTLGLLREVGLL